MHDDLLGVSSGNLNSSSHQSMTRLPSLIELTAVREKFPCKTFSEIVSLLLFSFNRQALDIFSLVVDMKPEEMPFDAPMFSATGNNLVDG